MTIEERVNKIEAALGKNDALVIREENKVLDERIANLVSGFGEFIRRERNAEEPFPPSA